MSVYKFMNTEGGYSATELCTLTWRIGGTSLKTLSLLTVSDVCSVFLGKRDCSQSWVIGDLDRFKI